MARLDESPHGRRAVRSARAVRRGASGTAAPVSNSARLADTSPENVSQSRIFTRVANSSPSRWLGPRASVVPSSPTKTSSLARSITQ